MRIQSSLFLVSLVVVPILGEMTSGRPGHGLNGYGIQMYKPPCAYACRDTISDATLNCGTWSVMDGMNMSMASPECYASDDNFLQPLAWCIHTRCPGKYEKPSDVAVWKIEKYWIENVAGIVEGQPLPKE